jgi:hypothetical protein
LVLPWFPSGKFWHSISILLPPLPSTSTPFMIRQSICCHSLLYPTIFCSNVQHNTEHTHVLAHLLNIISPAIIQHMLYECGYQTVLSPNSEAPNIVTFVFEVRGSISGSISIFRRV